MHPTRNWANVPHIDGSTAAGIPSYSRLELSAIASADGKRASVIKKDFVFTIAVDLERAHLREVHNGRPVDPAKDTGIQVLFEFRHAAT